MTVLFDVEEQLRQAATIGDFDTVQKLFANHPTLEINVADGSQRQTALEIACEAGHHAIVEYLIAKDADLSHIDQDGFNAAHYACNSKDQNAALKIVQALFHKDPAIINKQSLDGSGDTCLHLAARRCNTALIRWLLDVGADTGIENATWRTAWDCSQEEVYNRAFFSTPAEMNRSLDSYGAFIEKEVTSGNARETVFDITMRTVKHLELYRLVDVHTLDIFILLELLPKRNVFRQSCQQMRRELCRSVDGALMQRFREPSCVFESHSDQDLVGSQDSDPADVANEKTYIGLEDIPLWRPASVAVPPPAFVNPNPYSQSQNEPKTPRGTKSGSSDPNYLSVVMPLLSLELTQNAEEAKTLLQGQVGELAQKLKYCKGRIENFDNFYIAPTLDEYCYPELDRSALDRRNRDQALMRGTEFPQVVMVKQAWVWQAQDALVFAPLGHFRAPTSPYTDALATSYGQVGLFLADELDCDDTDMIIVGYERSLVQLAEEVSNYVEETGMESIGIEKEKAFFHEIHDIREELSMIRRVLSQKEEVWREFASNAWPDIWADCMNGRLHGTNDSLDSIQQETHRAIMRLVMRPRQRIQYQQRLVAQLDEDAERVERSVTIQLDLKQKHASLQEAHSTAVMSAAVFGFAVITIIFTPLSFVIGLFALPIDRLQDSQIPSRWGGAGVYSSNYIGTWAATTEIVSVALTLAATWLALEYGLKYPVTRKTRNLLRRISDRLMVMRGNLWATGKDTKSDSPSKAKSEKRTGSIFGTKRRTSSLRDREEV